MPRVLSLEYFGKIDYNICINICALSTKEGVIMALIKCPECGKEVSDRAKKCPACGAIQI